jgi:ABC-type branched-subunit amino acid transport system ATPase component
MGLSRTFQVIRIYSRLTVLENLELSIQWGDITPLGMLRPSRPAARQRANELAEFFHLGHLRNEQAGNLSGGQRRLLEIAMALMPDPDLVLLDEATSGVNPAVIEQIKDRIHQLNREAGMTFLLVEHDIRFIADLCSRVVVLNYGAKLAEGTPADIMANDEVIEAYFGHGGDDGGGTE